MSLKFARAGNSNIRIEGNLGGILGLFLGMSVLTVVELIIYLTKLAWILLSSRRRRHNAEKKRRMKVTVIRVSLRDPNT